MRDINAKPLRQAHLTHELGSELSKFERYAQLAWSEIMIGADERTNDELKTVKKAGMCTREEALYHS